MSCFQAIRGDKLIALMALLKSSVTIQRKKQKIVKKDVTIQRKKQKIVKKDLTWFFCENLKYNLV